MAPVTDISLKAGIAWIALSFFPVELGISGPLGSSPSGRAWVLISLFIPHHKHAAPESLKGTRLAREEVN